MADESIGKKNKREFEMEKKDEKTRRKSLNIRWTLVAYDIVWMILSYTFVFQFLGGKQGIETSSLINEFLVFLVCIETSRMLWRVYLQIWRYGGIQSYIRLIVADGIGCLAYYLISRISPLDNIPMIRVVAFILLDLLGSLTMRMVYRYAYKCGTQATLKGRFLLLLLRVFARMKDNGHDNVKKINVAILGAGSVGVSLATELRTNKDSMYEPRLFIDVSEKKVGRSIFGINVIMEDGSLPARLQDYNIQEVIFAVPDMDQDHKEKLYELFTKCGVKIMIYDAPTLESKDKKNSLREFSVEELLFRKQTLVVDERTTAYYKDKVILITGGGGSIGSELCRQIAQMGPKQLIILDIYENCAYDIQQELKRKYNGKLNLEVEICSITNKNALERVFETYRPQIVINAAAHKHVPLMEHNVIEAIENNVFGCVNVIDCCEKYEAERFMMVSTDKAVNPTNVMGATKRMCEMIAQSASLTGKVKYSATRFGNVLGSAGSVIPLFKRQIAEGGPVTITDKRIIRYFMTIPEASQLVLASGAMAKNGELFVLDMGKPVKILDLAESMIRLTGAKNIEIIETGLRPGEKLYEELLVKTEELDKTDNKQIFIERDTPLDPKAIEDKLKDLREACAAGDDDNAKEALRSVVHTFIRPKDVNQAVGK